MQSTAATADLAHMARTSRGLRRAFGRRWAARVLPQTRKQLMRHADLSTTLTCYVSARADEIVSELWAAAKKANSLRNTPQNADTPSTPAESTQGPAVKRL